MDGWMDWMRVDQRTRQSSRQRQRQTQRASSAESPGWSRVGSEIRRKVEDTAGLPRRTFLLDTMDPRVLDRSVTTVDWQCGRNDMARGRGRGEVAMNMGRGGEAPLALSLSFSCDPYKTLSHARHAPLNKQFLKVRPPSTTATKRPLPPRILPRLGGPP